MKRYSHLQVPCRYDGLKAALLELGYYESTTLEIPGPQQISEGPRFAHMQSLFINGVYRQKCQRVPSQCEKV